MSGCCRGILTIGGSLPGYEWQPSMTVDPVRGRVWTITDGVFRTIVVEGNEGLIAFDTFWSPGSAQAYRTALERWFPRKRVHTIIYTHDHLDHTGFGQHFVPEVPMILAHAKTADVIIARASDGQLPPTHTWTGEQHWVDIDGAQFLLVYPGPTHGTGNTAAYFPEDRLLFMADTVIVGACYNTVPDYHWTSWIPNTRRLLGLDWDLYVPGHFWQLDRRGFQADLDLWEATAHTAQLALVAGVDVDDYRAVREFTYKQMDPSLGDTTFRFDEFAAINVVRHMIHYQTGGWGLPDSQRHDATPFTMSTSQSFPSEVSR